MATVASPTFAPAPQKSNIFTTPLKARQEAVAAVHKRNMRKGLIRLVVAVVALAAYSTFLYPQVTQYLAFAQNLKGIQDKIAEKETIKASLEETRNLHKADYDKQFKEEQQIMGTVFPEAPDKLGEIRLMENFAINLNAKYPPFEFNAITFQESQKGNGYTILPFQTTIRTTRENFDKFLDLVNASGNTDPKKDHIRLLDISGITLRYLGTDATGKDLGVDFSVQMKAYSR